MQKKLLNGKGNLSVFTIIKFACLALLIVFLVSQISGNKISSTGFPQMKEQVVASADLSAMQEADNQMIKRLYGLDPVEYEGVLLYYPTTNMGAEELFLIKLSDISQQEAVENAVNARLKTQKDSFEGYGVEQTAMLEKSIVDVQGNYILFVSSNNPGTVDDVFEKAL